MEIITTNQYFKLVFPYSPRIIEAIKSNFDTKARRYDPVKKCWYIKPEYRMELERFAYKYGFKWQPTVQAPEPTFEIPPLPELTIDIPLKMTLREYQRGGVAYNLIHKKVIIGDDMGLGKTGQAIASIIGAELLFQKTNQNPALPCLIICPNSVKYNWADQLQKWTGRNFAMILEDKNKKNYHMYLETNMAKFQIVNYESLKKYFIVRVEKHYDKNGKQMPLRLDHIVFDDRIKKYNSIIFDECHKIKDSKTQQSKFVEGLAHGKNFAFGLTGTPVVNKPKDLIHQLKVIGTLQLFGGYKTFTDRYCSGEREASNLKELNFMLNKHCFYRRSKQEVAKELPPKSRQIIQCDITTEREYKDAEANLTAYLRNYKDASDEKIQAAIRGKVMVQIGILKNISARGKIRDVIDYIDDVIENGEKIALFVHLKEVALIFKDHYHGSASITGSDDLQARQNSIRRFKEDPNCKIIVCSIKAAGIGIDGLQYASSTVAFIELPWHAADCDQCEDRLNRIGQERPVQSLFFLGRNTIDNHIFYDIIENKRGISDEVTGNTDKVEINFIDSIAKLYNIQ